ncbi:F-box/SPRY domain-containing protein 1 [Elysia marginata]|uniref:F-box/SPRY domain-containing protein 1 n=1 Tax=Elysia marginata TaxID=1093978 RepID=A0AAV4GGY7_9GAST|nr:F-box/SPRY domain-containing protein 1 [Elysia marginata]
MFNRRPQIQGDNSGYMLSGSLIAGVAGLVVLTMVVIVCAEKKVNPNVNRTGPPEWTRSLVFKPELNVGFGDSSEGIHCPTPYHVIRERLGRTVTDAARWTCPMTQGKHVFEVYWPAKKNRGHACCVGMGSADVNLTKQGRCSLVGDHSQSWGLDMPKQRSVHFAKMQQKLYRGIPDRFFVYIDMDSGKIGFGDDISMHRHETEFFGYICHGIPKNKEMYFMISMCAPNEQVHVHYRGSAVTSGGYNLIDTPSPLQLSKDNLGQTHVAVASAPPSYMSVVSGQTPVAYVPPPEQKDSTPAPAPATVDQVNEGLAF